MNADLEKLDFIKTIFEQIPQNSSNEHTRQEVLRFLLAHVQNGRLYKYRACNKNSFSNLKEGTLHCALDRKSTRLNSSHPNPSRMPSSA